MNFLALFLGLGIERLLTHLFHLREFHWLDPIFDWVLRNQRISQPNLAVAAAALTAIVVVIPVGIIEWGLQDQLQLPQYIFAVVVLLFCLGPRDLSEEVNDYCRAIEEGDEEEVREIATELLECQPEPGQAPPDVEEAVYAQANNRIFGVVFWFVLLGPTGAWLFRVLDLMQRRAAHYACQGPDTQDEEGNWPQVVQAILLLHRLLAWLPSRLLTIGYMLAGSYDGALAAWKNLHTVSSAMFPGPTDQLLGVVGRGAAPVRAEGDVVARARVARDLVSRTLWMIWCPVLALLTLYDLML